MTVELCPGNERPSSLVPQPVLHDGGEFISLSADVKYEADGVTAKYVVKGTAIGHTSLAFTGKQRVCERRARDEKTRPYILYSIYLRRS